MAGEMTELKHTPGPWWIDRYGVIHGNRDLTERRAPVARTTLSHGIGDAAKTDEANANFIITAVNNHDEMVELLRELAADLKIELDARYSGCLEWPSQKRRYDNDMEPVIKARALLKRIEGKEE